MFRKKEEAATDIKAFLGKGSEFEGKLVFQEAVRIDGIFKGEISSSETLIIGESAVIKAEIEVGRAIISGSVEGNIRAREKIELHPPAKVSGTIKTPKLVVMEGALFEGDCRMVNIEEGNKDWTKRPATLGKLEAVS